MRVLIAYGSRYGSTEEIASRLAGFDTVESIAAVDAGTVSEKTGIFLKATAKIVALAKELLG